MALISWVAPWKAIDKHGKQCKSPRLYQVLSVLRVAFSLYKTESAECVTVISLDWLCLTAGLCGAAWLEIQHQSALVWLLEPSTCPWILPLWVFGPFLV